MKSLENLNDKFGKEVDLVLQDFDVGKLEEREDIDRLLKLFRKRGFKAEVRYSKVQLAFRITVWKEEYVTKSKYGTLTPKYAIEVIQKKPWLLGKIKTAPRSNLRIIREHAEKEKKE